MKTINSSSNRIIFITLFTATFGFFACKKEKKEEEPATSNSVVKTQIMDGKWRLVQVSKLSNGVLSYQELEECTLDDVAIFKNDTYENQDGEIKCEPSSEELSTWSLFNNDENLKMADEVYSIKKINSDSLILINDFEGTMYTYHLAKIK
ncbi:MAG: lipocalin family protein [Cytophagaceae bacterium]|jgi:hypothetical protein|nr:lipocalin family protein [Cytophagaceae bacterium]